MDFLSTVVRKAGIGHFGAVERIWIVLSCCTLSYTLELGSNLDEKLRVAATYLK